jgi:hypothetical protein
MTYCNDAADHLARQLAAREEAAVTRLFGLEFRQDINIRVCRPRWMPNILYRWLMRTVVVTKGPMIVGNFR